MTFVSNSEQILITATRYLVNASSSEDLSECASLVENRHLGWLVVTDLSERLLYSTPGASEIATFFRSSAKPFQAFPLVEKGFYRDLTTQEVALACASHTGSQLHIDIVQGLLAKAGIAESQLQCGPHRPIDPAMQETLRHAQKLPGRIHNNCSGKHAAMLFYCRQAGLDAATYLEPNHPLQQAILRSLCHWGNIQDIPLAIDGCGAPVFYLPLKSMALLYAHLGSTEEFMPLRQAMTIYPELIGGNSRVDTVIMQASQGKLLAKVGADGVLCVAQVNSGQGLALKLADGSAEVRDMALVQILIRLGWLDEAAQLHEGLALYQRNQSRVNTQNKVVGEYQVHFNWGG